MTTRGLHHIGAVHRRTSSVRQSQEQSGAATEVQQVPTGQTAGTAKCPFRCVEHRLEQWLVVRFGVCGPRLRVTAPQSLLSRAAGDNSADAGTERPYGQPAALDTGSSRPYADGSFFVQ